MVSRWKIKKEIGILILIGLVGLLIIAGLDYLTIQRTRREAGNTVKR